MNKSKIFFLSSLLIVFSTATILYWQIYRSYHTLVSSHISVGSSITNQSLSIALLADLHGKQIDKNNEVIIRVMEKYEPDLICLAGDMVDENDENFSDLLSLCSRMKWIAPVFYAVGNKELDNPLWNQLQSLLEKQDITVLERSYIDLNLKGIDLRIGGLYDYSFSLNGKNTVEEEQMNPETVQFLRDFESTNRLKILLSHRPDSFYFNNSEDYWKVDYVLSGHTHGGQVLIPYLGPLWAPDQGIFPQYTKGIFKKGETDIITTSGLSSGNEKIPRFNNPPEILFIEIKK